ncbi:MAG TPA: hypothetical protein VNF47_10610 [Streptosporangiaceae bacterium]|nr:hypothetical protein [Streptosporangiaceae bacterium]
MDAEIGTGMDRQADEAVEVLREVWTAHGQASTDLDEVLKPQKSCKNMQNVGFDGLAGPDGDLRSAWRAKLQREGKLGTASGSVRDLVLGTTEPPR